MEQLLRKKIELTGSMTLLDGILTTFTADANQRKVYGLEIVAGGNITVDTNGLIDLDGKGYPSSYYSGPDFTYNTRAGCHGGMSSTATEDCTYGRLEDPSFAGSAGYNYSSSYPGTGGGVLIAHAAGFINNGTVTAVGISGRYGGAGGSINIEADDITGSASGVFRADGGASVYSSTNYYRGGGGRVALIASTELAFVGDLSAKGGVDGVTGTNAGIGGAGTIYLKSPELPNGHLVARGTVYNGTYTAAAGSTPIRSVGRHTIQDVADQGDGTWRVSIGPNGKIHHTFSGAVTPSGTDSLQSHSFTLTEQADVVIEVTSANFDNRIYLLSDNGALSYVTSSHGGGENGNTRFTRTLSPGNYQVVIGNEYFDSTEAINGARNDSNPGVAGNYTLTVDTFGGTWRPTHATRGWGIDGLQIDLDADDAGNSLYTIQSNDDESIVIETDDDLSGYVGKDMIGVHQFSRITAADGAKVTFGKDRVIIDDVNQSEISNQSEVEAAADSVLPDPEP
jgi:hypothetical protein